MNLVSIVRMGCAILLGLVASVSWAGIFDKDQDPDEKPWVEAGSELPAFPAEDGLIPFKVGIRTDMKFLVDGRTISVGSDGVIRYSLVVISAQGVRNISYEGMRCETAERRSYAFGRSDGTWSKARGDRWVRIHGDSNNHYVELFMNYFCAIGVPTIITPEAARQRLLKGGVGAL